MLLVVGKLNTSSSPIIGWMYASPVKGGEGSWFPKGNVSWSLVTLCAVFGCPQEMIRDRTEKRNAVCFIIIRFFISAKVGRFGGWIVSTFAEICAKIS